MADSYSVQAVLSVKDKNFTSTLKNAERSLSNLDTTTTKSSGSVGALGTAFAIANTVISSACSAIKDSVGKAVERVDTLNQYPEIMQQMGFSADDAQASIDKLSEGIQGLPTSLDDIVSSAQNIALISGNLDEATDVTLALNDALLASGSSTDDASAAMDAYTKMLSAGKVDSQHWTTLEYDMQYALQQVAQELGITSGSTQELYTAMQNGEITFDDFNQALITCSEGTGGFAEMAQTSSQGIQTSWENVKTAVVRGVANMIQAWNDAAEDNGLPTIQESLNTFRGVVDTVFNAASSAIGVFVGNLDVIVAAVAPVVTAIAGLEIAKKAAEWFNKFKDSGKKAADALDNYKDTIDKAKDKTGDLKSAEENLKTATDNLKSAQDKSKSAMDKVTSASKDLKKANEKVTTAQEDLQKATDNTTSSEEDLKTAQDNLTAATEEAKTADDNYKAAKDELKGALEEQAEADEIAQAATEQYNTAQEEQATAIEGATLKAIAHNAIMAVMSGEMKVGEAAMKAFNAACDANPIGLVVTAVSTLTGVLSALMTKLKDCGVLQETAADRWKDMKTDVDNLTDSLEDTDKELDNNRDAVKKNSSKIRNLAEQVVTLADNENRSATQTETLKSRLDELNGLVPGLNAAFDDNADSLNMATDALQAYCDLVADLDELTNVTDTLETKQQELADVTAMLKDVEDEYKQSCEDSSTAIGLMANSYVKNLIAMRQEKNSIEDLKETQEQYTAEVNALQDEKNAKIAQVSADVQAAYDAECAALQEAVANDTISYEQLSEVNQQTVDDMKASIDDLVSKMDDGTQAINTDLGVTRDKYLETMEQNQQAVAEWGDNMESLRDRFEELGLDQAILDQWAEVPDQGIPLAATFVNGTDDELRELAGLAESDAQVAGDAYLQAWGATGDEIPSAIQEYITDPTNDSISEQLREIDWAEPTEDLAQNIFDSMGDAVGDLEFDELGLSIDQGVGDGMEENASFPQASAKTTMELIRDAAGEAAGEGSPATEWIPLGESMDEGVAKGLEMATAGQEAAKTLVDDILQAAEDAMSAADFSGAAESMCSSMATATTSGMSKVSTAVTKGMNDATKALTNGFKSMASATTSNMNVIKTNVTTGMNTVRSTVQTVMSAIQSNVQTILSNIKSNVTNELNNIKTQVTTTMNNIKSTVSSDLNTIKSTVSSAMSSIKSTVSSAMNSIKSTISSAMNSIKSTISSAMNSCKSYVSSAMSSIRSSFSSGMNACVSTARSACSSIISAFSGMYSSMYSAGANAMSGLQAGLNSRSGSVISTARSIANSVTSTINSALKVGSPSRVLKQTGKWAGEGLVDGLKAMLSDVKSISAKMADAVTDMVFGSFDAPALAFDGGAMTMSYYFDDGIMDALDDLTDALMDDDRVYEFTIPVEIDGREVAKATATFTQDELNKLQARDSRRQQFSISQ